jgi:hypothetical protein
MKLIASMWTIFRHWRIDAFTATREIPPDQIDAEYAKWLPATAFRTPKLTGEDAPEIVSNLAGFFQVLREGMKRRERKENRWRNSPDP